MSVEKLDTSRATVREISQVRKRSTNIVSNVEKRDILKEIACQKQVVSQGRIYETTKRQALSPKLEDTLIQKIRIRVSGDENRQRK